MKPVQTREDAIQALEATLLRQLIQSSGAFKGGEMAGGTIRADMFVETLADAVAKAGGLGLASLIEKSLPADAESDLLGGLGQQPGTPHLPSQDPTSELLVGEGGAKNRTLDPNRALNAYGNRAEEPIAGRPRSPKKGDAP